MNFTKFLQNGFSYKTRHVTWSVFISLKSITFTWNSLRYAVHLIGFKEQYEFHNLCASPDTTGVIKSRKKRWEGRLHTWRRWEIHTKIVVVKPEGRRQLGRSRSRWKDNIKMILNRMREMGCIGLDQKRVYWRALLDTVLDLLSSNKGGETSLPAERISVPQE